MNEELSLQMNQKEATALAEKQEELDSQRLMLSSAFDELAKYSKSLETTLATLKERNTELEKLLYQSSHGLRSPVSSIQGILNLMKEEPISGVVEEYRQHIEAKAAHMLEILNSLNSLAELVTKTPKLELVDVNGIVKKLLSYFSALSLSNGVRLDFMPDAKLKPVMTDAFLVTTFLKQIIMNALTFRTKQKKEGVVSIRVLLENNNLMFRIEDDGEGIDPALGNRIYEMFFRGSEKSGGSGLGLFIAKKAIDLLNGTIQFWQREPGTVFEVGVPI